MKVTPPAPLPTLRDRAKRLPPQAVPRHEPEVQERIDEHEQLTEKGILV